VPYGFTARSHAIADEWSRGNQGALERLMPLVYAELHRMASRYMAAQPSDHTLQTTALIHEAYLRLAPDSDKHWKNRAHFFRVAPKSMRMFWSTMRVVNSLRSGAASTRSCR
jgi:hypothetical protein